MRNKTILQLAIMGWFCIAFPVIANEKAAASYPASITVEELLTVKKDAKKVGRIEPLPRKPGELRLVSIYGSGSDLKFDVYLNGKILKGVSTGQSIRSNNAYCRVLEFVPGRCLTLLDMGGQSEDVCPTKVCWTGEAPPAPPLPPLVGDQGAGRSFPLTPAPVPIPYGQPLPKGR